MIGYIRDPRNWASVKTVTITSYELPLETAQGETGKATIAGQLDADYSRYMISFEDDERIYKITGAQTGSSLETVLTISDWMAAFEGELAAVDNGYISEEINSLFLFGTSALVTSFCSPVIAKSNFTPTAIRGNSASSAVRSYIDSLHIPAAEAQPLYEASTRKLYKYDDVLRVIQNHGVTVTAGIRIVSNASALVFEFGIGDNSVVVVPFNDGHSELISESYKDDKCTCVNLVLADYQQRAYYLDGSNSISTSRESQSAGYTIVAQYDSEYGSQVNQAAAIFASNTSSHKIEFASDKTLHIGQPVKLMTSRGVLDTSISKVMKKSGDDRLYYTCGELPVTATERIKADSWDYGTRLPANPRKGQIFIMEG